MVVETSAAVAILLRESGHEDLSKQLLAAESARISAVSFVEASMVLVSRIQAGAGSELDNFIDEFGIVVVPVSVEQAQLARQAFLEYGKGRHKAGLNFGDCFSYALAKWLNEPLLFK